MRSERDTNSEKNSQTLLPNDKLLTFEELAKIDDQPKVDSKPETVDKPNPRRKQKTDWANNETVANIIISPILFLFGVKCAMVAIVIFAVLFEAAC